MQTDAQSYRHGGRNTKKQKQNTKSDIQRHRFRKTKTVNTDTETRKYSFTKAAWERDKTTLKNTKSDTNTKGETRKNREGDAYHVNRDSVT